MKEIKLVIILFVSIIFIFNWLLSAECKSKALIQNLEYNYGILQGCMIKKNSKWIDYEKYITIKE